MSSFVTGRHGKAPSSEREKCVIKTINGVDHFVFINTCDARVIPTAQLRENGDGPNFCKISKTRY